MWATPTPRARPLSCHTRATAGSGVLYHRCSHPSQELTMFLTLSIQIKSCPYHHYHTFHHHLCPKNLEPKNLRVHSFCWSPSIFQKAFQWMLQCILTKFIPLAFSDWAPPGPTDMKAIGYPRWIFPNINFTGRYLTHFTLKRKTGLL